MDHLLPPTPHIIFTIIFSLCEVLHSINMVLDSFLVHLRSKTIPFVRRIPVAVNVAEITLSKEELNSHVEIFPAKTRLRLAVIPLSCGRHQFSEFALPLSSSVFFLVHVYFLHGVRVVDGLGSVINPEQDASPIASCGVRALFSRNTRFRRNGWRSRIPAAQAHIGRSCGSPAVGPRGWHR